MPRIRYENWKPSAASLAQIEIAESICASYQAQGYDLTLRQLYYRFVAAGHIPNTQRDYKNLGTVINKARMAGLLDWDYIVDRTRNLRSLGHWTNPGSIINGAARSYALDKWADQPVRVEVWVEKEALAGVVSRAAERWDCAWFSCRGYVSQSELWGAARRHLNYIRQKQRVVVIHLGDHDPSGIDMTRDLGDRLETFMTQDWLDDGFRGELDDGKTTFGAIRKDLRDWLGLGDYTDPIEINRIALNMPQIEEYDPPPNPAKLTDSRSGAYVEQYGDESWELDALDPATLDALIEDAILEVIDRDRYDAMEEREEDERRVLTAASRRWAEVADFLNA